MPTKKTKTSGAETEKSGELYIVGEQHGNTREDEIDSRAGAMKIGVGKPQYLQDNSDLNQPRTEESSSVDSISGGASSGSAEDLSDYDTITDSNTITSPSIISGAYMTKGATPKNQDEELNEALETDSIEEELPGKEQHVELFHMENCPYSKKVREFIESNGLKNFITYSDIAKDESKKTELADINQGNTQTPCLVIDGEPMLESDDIIDWLKLSFQMEMSS